MENILKNLIKTETVDMKKYIFFMMIKFSMQLKPVPDKHTYTPFIYIYNRRIQLVYEDEETGLRSVFTKYEEILAVLQMLFNEGKDVFYLYESDEGILSKEEILAHINDALNRKDEKAFREYSEKLKQYEKGE